MADGTEIAEESWQVARVRAAANAHPVPKAVAERVAAAMEAQMITKQLTGGELDRLAAELLVLLG